MEGFCKPFFLSMALVALAAAAADAEHGKIRILPADDHFTIAIGDQLFSQLHIENYPRPILYPVLGPKQTPMTRNYPMKKDVPGEADDHPHHKSIWCGHGDINGVSFWHEEGKIQVDRTKPIEVDVDSDGHHGAIAFHTKYLSPDGEAVCTDETTIHFRLLEGDVRAIDWETKIHASHGNITFGDTKEGMMAIRTHPSLRIQNDERRGVTTANGQAVNSEGIKNAEVWGKRAKWVDYSGKVVGNHVGVAIFDHPQNFRHPTTWHARTYGLVAANPFGLSQFEDKPEGTGDLTVPAGKSFRFRYRFVLHPGDAEDARIAELYEDYAN